MDAAAPRAEPKRGTLLIPPNYVSLRHLQELRLKEKEEQRQREEEAAAIRVREEQRQREKEAAARRAREEEQRKREEEAAARRVREKQRKREEEEEDAARRLREEQRKREEDAARRVKEAAAVVPKPEMKAPSNTSFRHTERPRGGQRFVVVAQREPPPQGNGTVSKNKDVGTGGYRGKKGPDGDAANAPHGGGRKVENKGKEKVSVDTEGDSGDPAEPVTTPSLAGEPEEKRKVEALGYQGTSSGTSDAPGEPAEAPISSSRTEYKPKGKKGLSGCSTRTTTTSEPADASPMQGVKSANKGKKKPSEGRCLDVAPISDLPDGKSLQPRTATESSRNRRRRGGSQGINPEAKSEGPEKKQPVVEVKAQPCPSVDGISNSTSGGGQGMNLEATSEGPGKKQPGVDVRVQPHPATKGSSNRRGRSGQGTIEEAKSEALGEKQPVVGVRAMARRKPREWRSSAWQYGAAQQHDMAWIPKPAVVKSSEEVE